MTVPVHYINPSDFNTCTRTGSVYSRTKTAISHRKNEYLSIILITGKQTRCKTFFCFTSGLLFIFSGNRSICNQHSPRKLCLLSLSHQSILSLILYCLLFLQYYFHSAILSSSSVPLVPHYRQPLLSAG